MGKDIREADRSNVEIFNEPVFCEVEWSAIYDADINDRGKPIDKMPNEEEFKEFTDKSVVYLCIKLLQKQQVKWPFIPCDGSKKKSFPQDTKWPSPDCFDKKPFKKPDCKL